VRISANGNADHSGQSEVGQFYMTVSIYQ